MRAYRGVTLIEVLVAVAVAAVLMGVVVVFFSQQTRLNQRVSAESDARVKVRTVGEVVGQDLEIAGSRATYDTGSSTVMYTDPNAACNSADRSGCVVWDSGNDVLSVWYMSSLGAEAGAACHRIDLHLEATTNVLYRRDRGDCGAAADVDFTDAADQAFVFARGITDFSVTFSCDDGSSGQDPSTCFGSGSYVRKAAVHVVGQTVTGRGTQTATFDLDVPTSNLRPKVDYVGSAQ